MKINVIGLGYIGLPTAAMFAKSGNKVLGIDVNLDVIKQVNAGKIHIEEPGLANVVKQVVTEKKLSASTKPLTADVHIIAVPTPSNPTENHGCNLDYVMEALESIKSLVRPGNLIILESTVAPRTTEDVVKPFFEKEGYKIGETLFIAHCPERVLPGNILYELVNNNRIVGGITPKCSEKGAEVYSSFVKGEIVKTDSKVAEMSKLMENTYRDINIAIANELTRICFKLKIDVYEVIRLANKHPRVNILTPGPGVGGHCLTFDPYFIYAQAVREAKLIKLARDINNGMPNIVVNLVEKLLGNDEEKIISIFGVSYKANVDDTRESPSLQIANTLMEKGYKVRIHDPYVKDDNYFEIDSAVENSDLLLCLVGHDKFKSLNLQKMLEKMNTPLIFDVANVFADKDNLHILNYGNIYEHITRGESNEN